MAELAEMRETLRTIERRTVPERLSAQLRITASREHQRRQRHANLHTVATEWWARTSLAIDNLMRPLAIPFTGGLASALIMFSMVMPTIAPPGPPIDDVQTGWYTGAAVDKLGPFGVADDTIILDIVIDENGRMIDYSMPGVAMPSPALRHAVENNLLFTTFTPAEFFGQPTTGKLRIALRRSQVDVKG